MADQIENPLMLESILKVYPAKTNVFTLIQNKNTI